MTRLHLQAMLPVCACRILDLNFGMLAVPLDLALPCWCRWVFWKGAGDFVQCAFLAARARIEHEDFHRLMGPFPIADFRQVITMFADVLFVFDYLVPQKLLEMRAAALQTRHAID